MFYNICILAITLVINGCTSTDYSDVEMVPSPITEHLQKCDSKLIKNYCAQYSDYKLQPIKGIVYDNGRPFFATPVKVIDVILKPILYPICAVLVIGQCALASTDEEDIQQLISCFETPNRTSLRDSAIIISRFAIRNAIQKKLKMKKR